MFNFHHALNANARSLIYSSRIIQSFSESPQQNKQKMVFFNGWLFIIELVRRCVLVRSAQRYLMLFEPMKAAVAAAFDLAQPYALEQARRTQRHFDKQPGPVVSHLRLGFATLRQEPCMSAAAAS
jgi:hypothetical protein